ncbi:MAG: NAD(P)/FAD-dependent oxidoreductase [Clostridiales Family XIII bacterium]|jgi:2,4-dienoyl-CoA reductase-like NADH-dependent reductase (Old Yellow Enzyme family)/NADPH-dependent 2,4-dienoyl-CoA reductase/sulfur reductase-like enzyme|nr:NAD(P)/FAD-dependent oxidoreductase [Clostridiales Family XIII bacterium]
MSKETAPTMYAHLFSPIVIGKLGVKNRIFMAPMSTHLSDEKGRVTEEMIAYYEARAKGGAGFITVAGVLVDKLSRYGTFRNVGLFEDGQTEDLRRLTSAARAHGARICAQLLHPSTAASSAYNEGRRPIAASPVEARAYDEIPRAIGADEIRRIVRKFGKAAKRARDAGFDAVELHCCHRHGLLGNFLSPLHNKRVDAYGGDTTARLRFPLEVIAEVRKSAGEDFPIVLRMSATDGVTDGQSIAEGIYIARAFEKAGVSLIHLSNGTLDYPWKTAAPSGIPQAFNMDLAARVRRSVGIPLGFVGRLNEPWIADMVIEQGCADVAFVGRALISDPEFPNKAMTGKTSAICPCIGCLRCLATVNADGGICCTMNPRAGRELTFAATGKAAHRKKILVVGGGPAGLTCAAHAAERGHAVTLMEQKEQLGGQMYTAGFPPFKHDLAKGTKYLIDRAKKAGVTCVTAQATIENVCAEGFDCVVLAVGNTPVIPGFLKGAKHLVSAEDAILGNVPVGKNVVIVGGGQIGCETADLLIHPYPDMGARSRRVTIIEMDAILLRAEKTSARALLVERLQKKGCRILTGTRVERVNGRELYYKKDGVLHKLEGIDTVIAAVGMAQERRTAEQLGALPMPIYEIGDVVNLYQAISDGYALAKKL